MDAKLVDDKDFDVCYVFKKNNKCPQDAWDAVRRMCIKKYGEELHPIYDLSEESIKGLRSGEAFNASIRNCFKSYLSSMSTVSEDEQNEHIFFKVTLIEEAAERLAESRLYPLRIDEQSVDCKESVARPLQTFDTRAEDPKRSVGAMERIGRLWARYDVNDRPCEEGSIFKQSDRARLLEMEVDTFWNAREMRKCGVLDSFYPNPRYDMRQELLNTWATMSKCYTWEQPLEDVQRYFGDEVAFYWAFLEFYAKKLFPLAVFGTFLFVLQMVFDNDLNFKEKWLNWLRISYCFCVIVWLGWFLQGWARYGKALSIRWGTDTRSPTRIEHGIRYTYLSDHSIRHPVWHNRWIRHYTKWKYLIRQIVGLSCTLVATFVAVVLVNNDINDALGDTTSWPIKHGFQEYASQMALSLFGPGRPVRYTAALTTALCIKLLQWLWTSVAAINLTDFENHKYDEEYSRALFLKWFIFSIFDNFSPLFYIAFFKENFQPCQDMPDGRCLRALRVQLFMILAVGVVLRLIIFGVSQLISKMSKKGQTYRQHRTLKPLRNGVLIHWHDQIITVGLLTLFSLVIPILPLVVLASVLLEMRMDAVDICTKFQRPMPRDAPPPTFWHDVGRILEFLVITANVFLSVFATVGYDRKLTFKLAISLLLLVASILVGEYVRYKFPTENQTILDLKESMRSLRLEAVWGKTV